MPADDYHDAAIRPSQSPDAHTGESNRDAYSHLRPKRRRSLLTAADVAELEARRANKDGMSSLFGANKPKSRKKRKK